MIRKIQYIAIITLTFLLASCYSCTDSKKKRTGGQAGEIELSKENPEVEKLDETKDEAIDVLLKDFDQDSMYVISIYDGKTYGYAYSEAQAAGQLHGDLRKRDHYSIFPNSMEKKVRIAINTSELKGQWIYDQENIRGIKFNHSNKGGGMSSINNQDICFKEWKLLNGKFYIYYVTPQMVANDRHQFLVEEARIKSLNEKNLTFDFLGKTYRCTKQ